MWGSMNYNEHPGNHKPMFLLTKNVAVNNPGWQSHIFPTVVTGSSDRILKDLFFFFKVG